MAAKTRAPIVLGLTAASGLGYYFYNAGGNPKVAQRQFETDTHRAADKITGKHDAPYRSAGEAEKQGKRIGQDVGAKFDSAVNTVDRDISKAKHELESKAESARIDALKKIEEVDRKTTEAAAKSKGWFSSWFGGK